MSSTKAAGQSQTSTPKTTDAVATSNSKETSATINSGNIGSLQRAQANPKAVSPATILQMQRLYGNQAVSRLIARSVQTSPANHSCNSHCSHPNPVARSTVQRHADHAHEAEETTQTAGLQRQTDNHRCDANCGHSQPANPIPPAQIPNTFANRGIQRTIAPKNVIQRHSSFEHKMLGDVNPDDLMILASYKNLDKNGQVKLKQESDGPDKTIKFTKGIHAGKIVSKDDVLHVLEQEIRRINYFKSKPPKALGVQMGRKDYEKSLKDTERNTRLNSIDGNQSNVAVRAEMSEIINSEWQLRLVELPSKGNAEPLLITYGEMNTLADIYGNPAEMMDADPKNRYEIVQGIRQQSLIRFLDIEREVTGANVLKKKFGMHVGEGFDDAIGDNGRGGSMLGQVRLMGALPGVSGKKEDKNNKQNSYTEGLARNACHFAPESWISWKEYHVKARALAKQSYADKQAKKQAAADENENNALINNGFGDHFLQDSYAAGHLVNKTQIMKWFVKWLDTKPFYSDRASAEDWRKIQSIAYGQDGLGVAQKPDGEYEDDRYDVGAIGGKVAKDPQSVENMEGSWQDRFKALGLKVPASLTPDTPSFRFMLEWQEYAATKGDRKMTVDTAVKNRLVGSKSQAAASLKALQADDVARVDESFYESGIKRFDLSTKNDTEIEKITFLLKGDYIPQDKKQFKLLVNNIGDTFNKYKTTKGKEQYENKAMATTYSSYHKFINNTLLQAGTNVLHDYFCSNGLEVETGKGDKIGRIYGDDAMLGKDSAVGVQYSGQTARMSREAIFGLVEHGDESKVSSIDDIAQRFPDKARLKDGSYARLDKWHSELEVLCNTKIFSDTKWSIKDVAASLPGKTYLGDQVSKDQHGDGSAF